MQGRLKKIFGPLDPGRCFWDGRQTWTAKDLAQLRLEEREVYLAVNWPDGPLLVYGVDRYGLPRHLTYKEGRHPAGRGETAQLQGFEEIKESLLMSHVALTPAELRASGCLRPARGSQYRRKPPSIPQSPYRR